jgi:hypothetical protein
MPRIMMVILKNYRHRFIDSISCRVRKVFLVWYGQTYSVELSFEKKKTSRWIMSRTAIVIAEFQET